MVCKLVFQVGMCVLLLSISACSTQTPDVVPTTLQATAEPEPSILRSSDAAKDEVEQEKQPAPRSQRFVVRLDDQKLTAQHLRWMNRRQPGTDPSGSMVKAMADYWLNLQLLYEEAGRRGLIDNPQAKFEAELAVKNTYVRTLVQQVREQAQPTDEQALDYYQKNKDTDPALKEQRRFSFSHIKTKTLEQAQALVQRIKQGAEINDLIQEPSTADDAKEGEKVQKLMENLVGARYSQKFLDALLAASEGDIIGPVKRKDGSYEIARHERTFPAGAKPFEQVQKIIKAKLTRDVQGKTLDDLIASLKEKAQSRIVKSKQLLEAEKAAEEPKQRTSNSPREKRR